MMRIAAMLSALAVLAPTALDTSATAQGVGYICGAEHRDAMRRDRIGCERATPA